ncbi:heat shock protein DnaJ, partial [Mollisia scopiformis]
MSSRRWTPTDDYYEILGLSQNGTENEIKVAYRRLSLIVHPDRNNWSFIPKAREIAEILNNANETLMDKTKRREYD